MIRPFSASYECGCRLVAAGVPLDYPESLPREVDALRNRLYISQLGGDCESRVLDLGDGGISYIIAVRISTNLSRGIVVSDWSVTTPWHHYINWDYDAADVVPILDHPTYPKVLDSQLSDVLNKRRHLSSGRSVDGLLCGKAFFQSIPKSVPKGSTVHANLSITVDTGEVFAQDVEMIVDRRAARRLVYAKREGSLFEKRDSAANEVTLAGRNTQGRRATRRPRHEVMREIRCRRILSRRISCKRGVNSK
jgi:hypothetical protein